MIVFVNIKSELKSPVAEEMILLLLFEELYILSNSIDSALAVSTECIFFFVSFLLKKSGEIVN